MDQFSIQQVVERRKAVLAALDQLSEQFNQTLTNLTDGKPPSTEAPPIQLELPLEWSHHSTREHLLKVLEPCTKATRSQS